MTQEQALTMMAWCQLVSAIGMVCVFVALIYLIKTTKKYLDLKVNEILAKLEPVVQQAKAVTEQAKETVDLVGTKIDSITDKADTAVTKVGHTVQLFSGKLEKAVTPKVASVLAIVGAATRLLQLYQSITKDKIKRN